MQFRDIITSFGEFRDNPRSVGTLPEIRECPGRSWTVDNYVCSRTRDAFERVSVRDWIKRSFACKRRCTLVRKTASKPSAHTHMYILFNAH